MMISKRLAYFVGAGVVVVALSGQAFVAWAWLGIVAVLAIVDLALAVSTTELKVSRSLPAQLTNLKAQEYSLTVHNQANRLARWELRDLWEGGVTCDQPRHRGHSAGQTATLLRATLTSHRRGTARSRGYSLRSWGPLGICGRARTRGQEATVRVLPEFRFQKHLPAKLSQLRRLAGTNPVRLVAKGAEFESLRDYVPGDDVRDIEWHATGRQGRAVVKTWRPQSGQEVIICVDSSRLGATRLGDYPRLDTHLETALLLGALVGGGQDKASLLAFDTTVRAEVFSLRGSQILPQFGQLLAGVQPVLTEANWPALGARLGQLRPAHALIVICTALESAPSADMRRTLNLLAARHHVIVANTTDPLITQLASQDPTQADNIYQVAAATQSSQQADVYMQSVRQCGAKVVSAPPELMPLRIADTYLELKRSGEL